jgi:hypothetical protein
VLRVAAAVSGYPRTRSQPGDVDPRRDEPQRHETCPRSRNSSVCIRTPDSTTHPPDTSSRTSRRHATTQLTAVKVASASKPVVRWWPSWLTMMSAPRFAFAEAFMASHRATAAHASDRLPGFTCCRPGQLRSPGRAHLLRSVHRSGNGPTDRHALAVQMHRDPLDILRKATFPLRSSCLDHPACVPTGPRGGLLDEQLTMGVDCDHDCHKRPGGAGGRSGTPGDALPGPARCQGHAQFFLPRGWQTVRDLLVTANEVREANSSARTARATDYASSRPGATCAWPGCSPSGSASCSRSAPTGAAWPSQGSITSYAAGWATGARLTPVGRARRDQAASESPSRSRSRAHAAEGSGSSTFQLTPAQVDVVQQLTTNLGREISTACRSRPERHDQFRSSPRRCIESRTDPGTHGLRAAHVPRRPGILKAGRS